MSLSIDERMDLFDKTEDNNILLKNVVDYTVHLNETCVKKDNPESIEEHMCSFLKTYFPFN